MSILPVPESSPRTSSDKPLLWGRTDELPHVYHVISPTTGESRCRTVVRWRLLTRLEPGPDERRCPMCVSVDVWLEPLDVVTLDDAIALAEEHQRERDLSGRPEVVFRPWYAPGMDVMRRLLARRFAR